MKNSREFPHRDGPKWRSGKSCETPLQMVLHLLIVNINCQLDEFQSHLREEILSMSMKDYVPG